MEEPARPQASTGEPKPRVALMLALVYPGLGHLYSGHPRWAWAITLGLPWSACALITATALQGSSLLVPVVVAVAVLLLASWPAQAIHAAVVSRGSGTRFARRWFNLWYVYLGCWVLTSAVTNSVGRQVRASLLEPFKTPSGSMAPALLPGDQFFILKAGPGARWESGDIVVHRGPSEAQGRFSQMAFVQRVVAQGGQTVQVLGGEVFVEGHSLPQRPCPEPTYRYQPFGDGVERPPVDLSCFEEQAPSGKTYRILRRPTETRASDFGPARVAEGTVFLLGDNRDDSYDSRFQGPTPISRVLGRAEVIWLSLAPDWHLRWERIGQRL